MSTSPTTATARAGAPPTPTVIARAIGVTRHYGDTVALDNVDFTVREGEFIGLLGPNGAGKTTLLNSLLGLRKPTSGRIELFGGSPTNPASRRLIGVTPQESGVPPTLRVSEAIDFVAAHFKETEDRDELLERFDLTKEARRQTGGLSGGQKRRLALALAFVGRPRLVILDEPTTGLDVESRRMLWDRIREFHEGGGTVLLTTHYLEEIEALAKRVVVIAQGRIRADDSVGAIRGMAHMQRVSMNAGPLPDLPGVISEERTEERVELMTHDADQLVRALVRQGVEFSGLAVQQATLEEAFLVISQS
ncbi:MULTISPECIES: ABC transporter ATP-binding protein [Streptomyces]|uniref:ABC transporter ATP-binding protein n=1 Tax=Streptomyces TaxID=1883 RepID=UPI000241B1C6|nr:MULTISPECIES: ABC transporter ATP-binding protein [Streptomyces]EHM28172.1 ABC transporter related protein [Streptomyces sp. W007]MCX4488839.1 ABC transporter ATP-binding protein [Streptomyces anulatus]MCX4503392.1 ABC transporter ATP-binding protein [Streptomyces anulatus]MCX4520950.1 ABC transporter ATP-binding protein [Streptomyces anulatus]MCX4603820.1 ABC transporter ATP-binding protein [Streptomyces anulatus]